MTDTTVRDKTESRSAAVAKPSDSRSTAKGVRPIRGLDSARGLDANRGDAARQARRYAGVMFPAWPS